MVSALVGGFFGRSALATDDRIPEHYKTFSQAVSAIESSYVDKVEPDALVTSAIRGMLATLDPHSSYFTPQEYARMKERQEGRYYGIGVSIVSIDNDITAVVVFEGSPAYKKGIRSGDVIAKVNGETAKGWTTEKAMSVRAQLLAVGTANPSPQGRAPIPLRSHPAPVQFASRARRIARRYRTGH